jgi:carbon monoxide dehydrogenase subunit G
MTATFVESIEIARTPEDVFAYATDFTTFPEWQSGVVSAHPHSDGPPRVGSKAVITRRVGPRSLPTTEEITELSPPSGWTVRGTGGRLVATAKGTITPLDGGTRSRVTITLDIEGHGLGKLLSALVVRRQARKALPLNERQLKAALEHDA